MGSIPFPATTHADSLQEQFLSILPRVEAYARFSFRHVRCPSQRDDCIQEAVAHAWDGFVRLARSGRSASRFVSALARFAVLRVRSHRRLCGAEKANDVLSPLAHCQHEVQCSSFSCLHPKEEPDWLEALHDNRQSSVPDQVIFRVDFQQWLATLPSREQQIVGDLLMGEPTYLVAQRFGVSRPRISQLRRELHDSWQAFCSSHPTGASCTC